MIYCHWTTKSGYWHQKVDIENEKVDIHSLKLTSPIKCNVISLFKVLSNLEYFGRSEVVKVLNMSPSSASKKLIDKIKTIRKANKLSQIELAKRCNVPQSTIGRIENYSMTPSIDTLINILDVLNIEINLKEKN